jgi:hypothetical protein
MEAMIPEWMSKLDRQMLDIEGVMGSVTNPNSSQVAVALRRSARYDFC